MILSSLSGFFSFPQKTLAATSVNWTSENDFSQGNNSGTLDLDVSKGDIKLAETVNTYTDTTQGDFDKGISQGNDFSTKTISDGGVSLSKVFNYKATSTPAIANNYVYHSWLDTNTNYLYVNTYHGLSVVNTQGTADVADDTLVIAYSTASTPAIANNYVLHSWLDTNTNYLYVSSGKGLLVIKPDYNSEGTYLSNTIVTSSTPTRTISWETTTPENTAVAMQTRAGDASSYWRDDFDDGDTSNVSDIGWGGTFDATEANGTLTINDASSDDIYFSIDTGKAVDYFPAGSVVRVRVRMTTDEADYEMYVFTDEWEDGDAYSRSKNEWVILILVPDMAFSTVDFNPWLFDPTNPNDKFEIDWISVTSASGWGSWSDSYTNSYGSVINSDINEPYLQCRATLSSTDSSITPTLDSVTIAKGYQSTGTYTSNALSYSDTTQFNSFTVDSTIPTGTSFSFQYSLDSGETWNDITLSGNSFSFPEYTKSSSFQWRANLTTTDANQTPTIHSVTLNHEESTFSNNSKKITISKSSSFKKDLDSNGKNYTRLSRPKFQGNNFQAKNGRVKIYKRTYQGSKKKIAVVDIDKDGYWSYKFKKAKDGSSIYYIKTFDSVGNETDSSKPLKIIRDTKDPVFTTFPESRTYQRGDRLVFTATDETTKIDSYKVKLLPLRDKWRKQDKDFYIIPEDIPNGNYIFQAKVTDKAGNKVEREVFIKVADYSTSNTDTVKNTN